jgi:hypothetical protein
VFFSSAVQAPRPDKSRQQRIVSCVFLQLPSRANLHIVERKSVALVRLGAEK